MDGTVPFLTTRAHFAELSMRPTHPRHPGHLLGSVAALALWLCATSGAGSVAIPALEVTGRVQEPGIPPRTAADTYEKVYTLMRNSGALATRPNS